MPVKAVLRLQFQPFYEPYTLVCQPPPAKPSVLGWQCVPVQMGVSAAVLSAAGQD